MNVFMPYQMRVGGTATFVDQFKKFALSLGVKFRPEINSATDCILAITSVPISVILSARKFKIPIIQRLDGVISWSTCPRPWYPVLNFNMGLLHGRLARGVIYQSQFSRQSCEWAFGRTATDHLAIIYNGVDTEQFCPVGPKKSLSIPPNVDAVVITTGRFRRPDQILPIIKALNLVKSDLRLHWLIIGSVSSNLKYSVEGRKDITYIPHVEHMDLPKYLRVADLFLFSDRSACPNSILEAMACGLPIVAYGRGAIRELVEDGFAGQIVGDHGLEFWRNSFFDHVGYANAIRKILRQRDLYSNNARQQTVERFEVREMVRKYIEFMKLL